MLLLWRCSGAPGCHLVSDFVQLILLHKKLVGVERQEFHDPAYTGETRMHNIPGDHSSCSGSQDNCTIPRAKGQSAGKEKALIAESFSIIYFESKVKVDYSSPWDLFFALSFGVLDFCIATRFASFRIFALSK